MDDVMPTDKQTQILINRDLVGLVNSIKTGTIPP